MGNEQAGVDDLRLFCVQKRTMLFLNGIVPNFVDIVLLFGTVLKKIFVIGEDTL